jgi:hypothetical protein
MLLLSVDLGLRRLSDGFSYRYLLFSVTLHGAVVIEAKGNTLLLFGLWFLDRLVGGREEVKSARNIDENFLDLFFFAVDFFICEFKRRLNWWHFDVFKRGLLEVQNWLDLFGNDDISFLDDFLFRDLNVFVINLRNFIVDNNWGRNFSIGAIFVRLVLWNLLVAVFLDIDIDIFVDSFVGSRLVVVFRNRVVFWSDSFKRI